LKKENDGSSAALGKIKAKDATSVEQNKANSGNTVEVNKLQEKEKPVDSPTRRNKKDKKD
jgi:hypothetical protein